MDLGAEQLLAAEKDIRKIAVEVKSLAGLSEMDDLEKAIGQYVVYHDVLLQVEPERDLYLAVNEETFVNLFEEPIGSSYSTTAACGYWSSIHKRRSFANGYRNNVSPNH